jgi:predicted PurR-regulated permease PerM
MSESPHPISPRWGVTIKIVIGLSFALALGTLLVAFRSIIGPILLAVILAYFLHPLAVRLNSLTNLPWRLSVGLIYLLLLVLLIGFFTATGVVLVGQIESLFSLVRNFVNTQLPELIQNLSSQKLIFGSFVIDFSQFDLAAIGQQLLNNLQTVISQTGSLVGTLASGAVGIVIWAGFVLLISYFLLADAGRVPDAIRFITIPGYDYDIRRMSRELGRIWNAYLRGQFLVILIIIITAAIVISALGIRYALAIALMTGLARFVPYIGPFTTDLVLFLVAFFQGSNYFRLQQFYYALLVVGIAILVDQIFDNFVTPRIMGRTLGVHPAAVLIAAIILAQLIGFVGLVLAAPVLASLSLISRYLVRKLFDQDPWPEPEKEPKPIEYPWAGFYGYLRKQISGFIHRIRHRGRKDQEPESKEGESSS